ncbi:TrbG/VirB9 family P-type conjugative transfer protein [Novosphingobium mangrovi (ex Huang et al. 2023)]|uniref:TrbG/VirB9 family P-type conjugative transfer protein n=1 Tax=Novosphingobium mangrovi (ex Huang et al. 2023) TaxID=2976432 RepID=A0ABT2IAM2_9SPHN|nr:TrbG/VirB9 family P-type conjugative transfer protein [Novosphingobium mangrovi (ex Huang et al. 2023)]MCT2401856.1 TrbG/VirB9 family P-type conjugative transfer protein [Novosphingobium mangrovi (ex Huang et al. 2023)]
MKKLVLILAMATSVARAQELPPNDPRIAVLPAGGTGLLSLRTAPDVTQTLLFRQGETIASVILSDPTAFIITVAGSGDSLALRATRPSAYGVMTVRTNMHTYEFDMLSGAAGPVPAVVRLLEQPQYRPARHRPAVTADSGERFTYRLSGKKALRPTAIRDDGNKTYIEWGRDQAMPATFALGPTGKEQMVDGYMRGGIYTIDRVYETLIFRIDKERAKARRRDQDKGDGHG